MVNIETFKEMALSLPEIEVQDHWGKPSYRVKKKIFATLSINEKRAVVKLSVTDQSVFCAFDRTIIYPVAGGWGRQGWTTVELTKIRKAMLKDVLVTAWCTVAPKTLVTKFLAGK